MHIPDHVDLSCIQPTSLYHAWRQHRFIVPTAAYIGFHACDTHWLIMHSFPCSFLAANLSQWYLSSGIILTGWFLAWNIAIIPHPGMSMFNSSSRPEIVIIKREHWHCTLPLPLETFLWYKHALNVCLCTMTIVDRVACPRFAKRKSDSHTSLSTEKLGQINFSFSPFLLFYRYHSKKMQDKL